MQGYAQERNDSIYTTDSLLNNQRSDSILVHFLQKIQIPITDTNEVKLLKSGEEKFLCLFSEIKKAL